MSEFVSDPANRRAQLYKLLKDKARTAAAIRPASSNQIRSWSNRTRSGLGTATLWWAAQLLSDWRFDDLRSSIELLVGRHSSLRTSFFLGDETLEQHIRGEVEPDILQIEVPDAAAAEAEIKKTYTEPFDPTSHSLIRFRLICTSGERPILVIAVDHIVADLWSLLILIKELGIILAGQSDSLSAPGQYHRFAEWQSEFLASDECRKLLEFWDIRYDENVSASEILPDRTRPSVATVNPGVVSFEMSPARCGSLRSLSRQLDASPSAVMLASVCVLLQRNIGDDKLQIGAVLTGRSRSDFRATVGDFVNTLPILCERLGESSFCDIVDRIKSETVEALKRQDIPLPLIASRCSPRHGGVMAPLFRILFIHQKPHAATDLIAVPGASGMVRDVAWGGGRVKPLALSQQGQEDDLNDITFEFLEIEDRIFVGVRFNKDLYDEERVQRLVSSFHLLIDAVASDPGQQLRSIPILSETEHLLVAEAFNDTDRAFPDAETVIAAFEKRVREAPEAIAVRTGALSMTYVELNERAQKTAALLRTQGVGRDSIVAIYMDRSFEMVVAILAIWKAGGAYLPIDPENPVAHTALILRDASPVAILTQQKWIGRIAPVAPDLEAIALDTEQPAPAAAVGSGSVSGGEALAYVIYTSGSTGAPKGVLSTQAGLTNRIAWMQAEFGLLPQDVVLQKTPYTFDVSVWEFAWTLAVGASLVIAKPGGHRDAIYLRDLIEEEGVTTIHFVPSMFGVFMEVLKPERCRSLKRVICSGEALSTGLQDRFLRIHRAELHNLYGPTEASIDASAWRCVPSVPGQRSVSIGRPIANMRIYIRSPFGGLSPIGVPGELCIAGVGLARGYLNRPDLTADRFTPCPWEEGGRMYRTGDLACWRSDGTLEYLGRLDHQVKLRGFRIEVGEIEAVLASHPAIAAAAVVLVAPPEQEPRLYAYFLSRSDVGPDSLRIFLADRLPVYMVPEYWHQVEDMPVSKSGKLDRRALPDPVISMSRSDFEPPLTPDEHALAEIWAELFGISEVGRTDGFFALGGDSLMAIRMAAHVHKRMSRTLSLRGLFERPSLWQVAASLGGEHTTALLPIIPAERREYYPTLPAQNRLFILQQRDPWSTAYNISTAFRLIGSIDLDRLEASFIALMQRHESLRTSFRFEQNAIVQIVENEVDWTLERVSDPSDQYQWSEFVQPFELDRAPLLRARALSRSAEVLDLWLDVHHIILDGASIELLLRDLLAIYDGHGGTAPAIQPTDVAVWFQENEAHTLQRLKGYWVSQYETLPAAMDFLPDLARPEGSIATDGEECVFEIDDKLSIAFSELCQDANVTLYMAMLAAFTAATSRIAGEADIAVGTAVAARDRPEMTNVLGMFANTLAIRLSPDSSQSFGDYLNRVRSACIDAYDNQMYPFDSLVADLHLGGGLDRNPLFDLEFLFEEESPVLVHPEIQISRNKQKTKAIKFDLSFIATSSNGRLGFRIGYKTALFSRDRINLIGESVGRCIEMACRTLGRVSLAAIFEPTGAERPLLESFSAAPQSMWAMEHPTAAFEAIADSDPMRVAVEFGRLRMRYGELNKQADELACRLMSIGATAGSVVAICFSPSPEKVIALLAVLKSGAALVLLAPSTSMAQNAFRVAECKAMVVLHDAMTADWAAPSIRLGLDWIADPRHQLTSDAPLKAGPNNIGYITYRQDSEGLSNAVLVGRGAICNLLAHLSEHCPVTAVSGAMLSLADSASDLSLIEALSPLSTGGRLVLASEEERQDPVELLRLVKQHSVTHFYAAPALVLRLLEVCDQQGWSVEAIPGIEHLGLTGGMASAALVSRLRSAGLLAHAHLWFGCPEGTTLVASHALAEDEPGDLPSIGRPVAGISAFIVDEQLKQVRPGFVGELCLAGAGVAQGYLHEARDDPPRFVIPTWSDGLRLFRTGELARWRLDGQIQLLGRITDRVRVRGQRLNLGLVKATLLELPGVSEVALRIRAEPGAAERLVAYVASSRGATSSELRTYLRARLAPSVVPDHFIVLNALPIDDRGDLDHGALAAYDSDDADAVDLPLPGVERELAAIWSELLGSHRVLRDDNFFELGGHSLMAVRLAIRVEEVFNSAIAVDDVFQHPILADLAKLIAPTNIQPDMERVTMWL